MRLNGVNYRRTVKVVYENKLCGIKLYKNEDFSYTIKVDRKEVLTPDNQSRFKKVTPFPNGFRVIRFDGKEMCFIFKNKSWFFIDREICTFKRIFPFGQFAVSIQGETLKNYELN